MSIEKEQFLKEGMPRFKQASQVLVAFGQEMEERLQTILRNRQDWGPFFPKKERKATKSTKFWSQYPLFNARIAGTFNGKDVAIIIHVNWYASETDYPFYDIRMHPDEHIIDKFKSQPWPAPYYVFEDVLRFDPDPDDFNLERDFESLLDVYVGFLKGA